MVRKTPAPGLLLLICLAAAGCDDATDAERQDLEDQRSHLVEQRDALENSINRKAAAWPIQRRTLDQQKVLVEMSKQRDDIISQISQIDLQLAML